MADFQSTVNDLTARIKGSGVLEVSAYVSASAIALAASTAGTDAITWKNVGSIEGLAITENMTATQLQGDNAEEEKYVSEHTVTVAFNQREAILEEVRAIIRGSFDVSGTPVAGSLVEGATHVVASGAWGYNDPIVIEHQNYNLGAVTVNSLAGGTNATLVAGTDYFVGQDAIGRTVVTIIDSDTIDPATGVPDTSNDPRTIARTSSRIASRWLKATVTVCSETYFSSSALSP